jgi:hypothetical protein
MRIITSAIIPGPPDRVWPLLCSSKMDPKIPCLFRLGIPKPVECRLPAGSGGVGQQRQCISDRGLINQRITCWEAPHLLRFQMEDTTLYFRPCVNSIVEEFALEPSGTSQTLITRTTTINVTGFSPWAKGLIMGIGTKFVHRYVFKNWARLLARPVDQQQLSGRFL